MHLYSKSYHTVCRASSYKEISITISIKLIILNCKINSHQYVNLVSSLTNGKILMYVYFD